MPEGERGIVFHDSDTRFTEQFWGILRLERLRPIKRVSVAHAESLRRAIHPDAGAKDSGQFLGAGELHLKPRKMKSAVTDSDDLARQQ